MEKREKLEIKPIDVEEIIKTENSGILKKMPRFAVNIVKKIIHQDDLNRVMLKYPNEIGPDFLKAVLKEFEITLDIKGLENLPEHKKCFFAANHPFGVIDGLILTYIVSSKYGGLKAIANEAFMYVPQLHPFIIKINVFDGSSKEYLMALEKTYNQDIAITHFPAGIVSRKIKGVVQDGAWQKSFIKKAISSQRDIVPIYFHGQNSKLFYRVSSIRNFLRIKTNVELILFPREMLRKRGETIKVTIGEPIPYTKFDKSHTHVEWAQKVRDLVYNLSKM